jgi:hypothetical protein
VPSLPVQPDARRLLQHPRSVAITDRYGLHYQPRVGSMTTSSRIT